MSFACHRCGRSERREICVTCEGDLRRLLPKLKSVGISLRELVESTPQIDKTRGQLVNTLDTLRELYKYLSMLGEQFDE